MRHFSTLKRLLLLAASASLLFTPVLSAAAATVIPAYQASTSSPASTIAAGTTKKVSLIFTNTGTQTWYAGQAKTALYLYGTSSVFGHASWLKDDLPALVTPSVVKPGQTATASFTVTAPTVPGKYDVKFLLSYGSNSWIKGSTATIHFTVTGAAQPAAAPAPAPVASPVVAPAPSPTPTTSSDWKAELVSRGGVEWQMDPMGQAQVTVTFKNTGTTAWLNSGTNYVSLYTGTNNRVSPFKDSTWKSSSQVVVMNEAKVLPGQNGTFTFWLRGPNTPGNYTESFQLAAENKAWISGGVVSLPVRVAASASFIANGVQNGVDPSLLAASDPNQATAASGAFKTVLLLSSAKNLTLLGNGRQTLTFGFKNTGSMTWNTMSLRVSGVTPATNAVPSVRDESWISSTEAANAIKDTYPGQIGFIGFTLKAPTLKGAYKAVFKLYANNNPVEDGTIEIPITVTSDGYIEPTPAVPSVPVTNTPSTQTTYPTIGVPPLTGDVSSLPNEPIIRVGLFKTTDNQMVIRAVSGGFYLQQNGNTVCTFNAGESVSVTYDRATKTSSASGPRCTAQSSGEYTTVATDGISPLEMTDFNRPVSWLPGANDNKFRGKLQLHYAASTDSVWIINELPIEWYLKGIGETSNSSPQQYQRALLSAARTYAMYHVQRSTKHAAEGYTVDATYDQVYRGYGAEARDPNVVTAVDATRGQIVTYQGKLAITPYYSRSDGRTRSWTEVWGGGPYAWLVSVPVPWDNGKTLWGHGVGMSATGALGAAADGWDYIKILTYFYQNSEIRQIYK